MVMNSAHRKSASAWLKLSVLWTTQMGRGTSSAELDDHAAAVDSRTSSSNGGGVGWGALSSAGAAA
jgi:hypothetical protein